MDELRTKLIKVLRGNGKPALLRRLSCFSLSTAVSLTACDAAPKGQADLQADSAPTGYVDSIIPMDEAVRRFREGLPESARLEGGASSRDSLVRVFMRALHANDSSAVRRMLVSQAEYAYLYFPSSIYMNKPYELAPGLAWFLNVQNSEKGITRVMRRLGGHDLAFEQYSCAEELTEGENTFWRGCTVAYRDPQTRSPVTRRIFGTIMERDGHHKFLTYANDF
ncbi:MAG: hypothetical protein ACR2GJ_00890 [Gemmatimonadaceae bacterium]